MARPRETKDELLAEIARLRALLRDGRPLVHDLEVHREELALQHDELIRAQRQLEQSRDRYVELFDFSPTAYMGLDRHGVMTDINLTAARLLATERNRLIGFPFTLFVADTDRRRFLDHLLACRRTRTVHEVELTLRRHDRTTLPAHLTTKRADAPTAGFFVTITDLSEQHRVERERERMWEERARDAHERARVRAESEAKDRFIATLSHELRTPLTPILLAIATLERSGLLSDKVAPTFAMIRRNALIEARLIDDLLDVTRITHGKLALKRESTNVHAIIDEVIGLCAEEIRAAQLRVRTDLDAESHQVWADGTRLRQVFWNLLRNAIRHTPAGGLIIVRSANPAAHRIALGVNDTGDGIEPELLDRIFTPFEQAGGHRGRLGLGLAIARGVVEAHGGSITAASPGPGRGATFTVHLGTTPAIATATAAPSAAHAANGDRRVLLVEDNPDNAAALADLLRAYGYRVEVADSVATALRAAANGFDVLVSDIGLPDGTGRDLVRRLVGKRAVPAIALTGFGTDDDVRRDTEAGFARHLTKPVDPDELIAAIIELTTPAATGSEPRRPPR